MNHLPQHTGGRAPAPFRILRIRMRRNRPGTVLVITMLIVFALAGTVLTLGRTARVELSASANLAASIQASAVERGAEQYINALLTLNTTKGSLPEALESSYEAVPVGEGFFWVVRPDYGDTAMPLFGLVDEASKLNINSAPYDMLAKLPNMTTDVANAIVAYRGVQTAPAAGAPTTPAEPQSLGGGYYTKNSPFESVEELLQIQGFNRTLLYGNGQAGPLGQQASSGLGGGAKTNLMTDNATARGLYDLLTIYSQETLTPASTTGGTTAAAQGTVNINLQDQRDRLRNLLRAQLNNTRGDEIMNLITPRTRFVDVFDFYFQTKLKPEEFDKIATQLTTSTGTVRGKININTASRNVLLALPGLESADVDKLISARPAAAGQSSSGFGSSAPTSTTGPSLSWVATTLNQKAVGLGPYITFQTSRVSADILAVSGNGRAYKRVRVVFDLSGTTPQIIYRREITDRGWPLDPTILEQLRSGQTLTTADSGIGARSSASGGTFR